MSIHLSEKLLFVDKNAVVTDNTEKQVMKHGLQCPGTYTPYWDRCLKTVSGNPRKIQSSAPKFQNNEVLE